MGGRRLMTTKRQPKVCAMWDCSQVIRRNHFLCFDHYEGMEKGRIDRCPGCGRFKSARYETCPDCRSAKQGSVRSAYPKEHSDAWAAGDADATEFYVYILKLNNGKFYAGQTRELRPRLMEHRDGGTKSTAGKDPKLVWFTETLTREQATELEVELKELCDKNPREIRNMVIDFKDLVEELDFS